MNRHESHKKSQPIVLLNLISDSIHNFLDGVLIAASFIVSPATGVVTTMAIGLHEIPQEIGDFAILMKGGLTKGKAALFNFFSAMFAVLGGIVGYFFLSELGKFLPYFVSFAAGGFLYIATTDVLPELHKEKRSSRRIILQTIVFLIGVTIIGLIIGLLPE